MADNIDQLMSNVDRLEKELEDIVAGLNKVSSTAQKATASLGGLVGATKELNSEQLAVVQRVVQKAAPQMTSILKGAAKGGTPTEEGLAKLQTGWLTGEITQESGYRRAGGNSKVWFGPTLVGKLQAALDEALAQVKLDLDKVSVISGGPNKTDVDSITAKATKAAPELTPDQQQQQILREYLEKTKKEYVASKQRGVQEAIAELEQQDVLTKKLAQDEADRISAAKRAARDYAAAKEEEIQQLLRQQQQLEILQEYESKQTKHTASTLQAQMGNYRSQRLVQEAGKYNFAPEDIKQIYTQQPSGVTTAKFEKYDEATKAYQRLEVAVDKFGNTINRTNKRLLGFTDSIVRNTQEVLKWSVGVGLVYGTMYKLQALIKTAIENESKLADVAVVLGSVHRDLNEIFDEAAKVAKETGESINAVLETYSMAYRAVGAIEDPIKKSESAMQLLTDATVLNKLSNLDAASSIDILAGSLRQMQRPEEDMAQAFAKGADLLDAWVVVSRKANVDLATLATAFSITQESAENSGVSIEQLNAIIASLAEKIGGLGGRETGNAVRALIGGVYQQQAAEILTRYGIAAQDTAGRMRPFLDISKEIYTLYKQGTISADELNKIGYTLGGGVRRGQQYVAFLSDFERIQELTTEQAKRHGAAQAALATKMETTQTALTNLNNAFQSLAQTLGTNGGILDSFKDFLGVITAVVGKVDELTKVLGKLTIPAAMLGITGMMFRGEGGKLRFGDMSSRVGGFIQGGVTSTLGMVPRFNEPRQVAAKGGMMIDTTTAEQFGQKAGLKFGSIATASLIGALPGIMKLAQGDLVGAGFSMGGAILGAIATGGNPVGAMIGSFIADAFINQTLEHKPDFDALFVDAFGKATKETEDEMTDAQIRQAKLTADIFKEAGGGNAFLGTLRGRYLSSIGNLQQLFKTGTSGNMTAEQGALYFASRNPEIMKRMQEEAQVRKETTPIQVGEEITALSTVEKERVALLEKEKSTVDQITATREEQLRTESAMGKIKPKEQLETEKTLMGLDATLSKLYTAFGKPFDELNENIAGTEQVYQAFSDIVLNGTQEQVSELVSAASEWMALTAAIEKAREEGSNFITTVTGEEIKLPIAQGQADELRKMYTDYLNLLGQEQKLSQVKLPEVVGMEDISSKRDYEKVFKEAQELQQKYFDAGIRDGFLTPEQVEIMISRAEDLWVYLGEDLGYQLAKGITDSKFLTEAFNKMQDEVSKINLGFQTFDVTNPQLKQVVNQANAMANTWAQKYGYTPDYTEELAITMKDNVIQPMKADWKIVQYLLQQILDTEKDQLDGIYNLPEGASFYVPSQTLDLAYQKGLNEANGGGGAGFGEVTPPAMQGPFKSPVDISDKVRGNIVKEASPTIAKAITQEMNRVYLPSIYKKPDKYSPETYSFYKKEYPEKPGFFENASNWLQDLIPNIYGSMSDFFGKQPIPFSGYEEGGIDLKSMFDNMKENIQNVLSFNLNTTSTIQLVVDGKVLATVIKQYLYQDMIRSEGIAGSINRTLVI